jgi:predicted component of type VI protein secretion system
MLSLAGALTTFSLQVHPRDLPVYDHDVLGTCFSELDEKLRFLLETVVPSIEHLVQHALPGFQLTQLATLPGANGR